MGADKAFVAVDGQPMVLRVAAALRGAGAAEILTVGGDVAALRQRGLDARPDPRQGEGPLGGLVSAFELAGQEVAVVLATDLAWIDAATITRLLEGLAGSVAPVAVARADRLEPLCAAWRVEPCQPVVAAAFEAGERAVHRALASLDVTEVSVAPGVVANANTPADLHR